jgi:hypothetical protein
MCQKRRPFAKRVMQREMLLLALLSIIVQVDGCEKYDRPGYVSLCSFSLAASRL